ncbi:GIY-YIG nuclease family protein [Allonocardiopsis opalescens]|uniref:GIY-YIG catalytic domain-containing protein n=1 Tax=Allonocardiopsis opalescens TaxID=1144618 RepID=A0A2T0PP43_9ACTN|nr:GIY-YIG nuclease family protein [Allonocardiopsis opalescens]PRX90675.1 GIY-YIG catalytic domain-containing protein [Allonocardiopsis opalescens]
MTRQQALYRFYDDGGQLLYVGVTNDPPRRIGEHAKDKTWWTAVRGMTVDWYSDRPTVLAAERRAITVENPLHNIHHRGAVEQLDEEISREDNLHIAAAVRYCQGWSPEEDWKPFIGSVQRAIDSGFSSWEILEAATHAGRLKDPQIDGYLPAYPGHPSEETINATAAAMRYLSQFVQDEVEHFRAMAEADSDMWHAHWHEVMILAAHLARTEIREGEGRDVETLKRFLSRFPYGQEAMNRAYREWELNDPRPPGPDSPEVVELAVSSVLGTEVPDGA